jgi:hypothetical protein
MGHALPRGLATAAAALLRAVLAVAGVVMLAGFVLMGLMIATVVVAWALLRGRRPPPVRFAWRPGQPARPAGRTPVRDLDVVDVEAREVPRTR